MQGIIENICITIVYLLIGYTEPDLKLEAKKFELDNVKIENYTKKFYDVENEVLKKHYPILYRIIPNYSKIVIDRGNKYNLDPYFITAILLHESKGKWNIRGNDGEYGLMQVMPYHFASRGIPHNKRNIPEINIDVGSQYLRYCSNLRKTKNSTLGCYNAGPGYVYNPDYHYSGKRSHVIDYIKKVSYIYDTMKKGQYLIDKLALK